MTEIRIPTSIEDAGARLASIDRIATAVRWERAAIVWAFAVPSDLQSRNGLKINARSFAEIGIAGLRSTTTVMRYWQEWQDAIDEGIAQPVSPGDDVALPDDDKWKGETSKPGLDTGRRLSPERREAITQRAEADGAKGATMALHVAANPAAMASAIIADPETRRIAADAVARANEDVRPTGDSYMRGWQKIIAAIDAMQAATHEHAPAAANFNEQQMTNLRTTVDRLLRQINTYTDLLENPVSSAGIDDEYENLLAGG